MEKFCVNCKHYREGSLIEMCYHKKNAAVSLVTGKANPKNSADFLRGTYPGAHFEVCGPDGAWFEPREQGAA